jgi:serine phosphatase RsbU (regulator of sigma subunit)
MLELERLPAANAAPPSTILIVDDNPVNLQLLVRTLDGSGHRLLAARSGRAALEIARQAHPDLVLLDVMMPEMNGFDVCIRLKAEADTQGTAVIFLSALGDVDDKVSGLTLGAVDYITKPIQPEEVQVRVSNALMRRHLERELRRSRDRLDRELAKAGRLQQQLLPRELPSPPGIEFGRVYRTSRHAGGDYYDVLDLGGGRLAVVVADVSGHGASAAIVMAMLRSVLHAHPGHGDDPAAMLGYVNRHFSYLWGEGMFATAVYGVIDTQHRTITFACAGHPPPLVMHNGGRTRSLDINATQPLLLGELPAVPSCAHTFEPGDRLLFYTDGVTDRENPKEEPFEVERLIAALEGTRGFPVALAVDCLIDQADQFASGREADDDQTLLMMAFG